MPNPTRIREMLAAAERARAELPALPGLQRADKPLRIAMLSWARISMQAREGSGLNLSVSELAAGLAAMGHSVSFLSSGMDYSLTPGMRIVPTEIWRGVACFSLYNSPNLATGNLNFCNMERQMESRGQTSLILEWIAAVGAQAVHIHAFEGIGFDIVKALRNHNIPVVVTPHNYFAVCPQIDLLQNEKRICLDYDGGHKCVGCLPRIDPGREILNRRWRQTLRRWCGLSAGRGVIDGVRALRRRIAGGPGWPRGPIETTFAPRAEAPPHAADPVLDGPPTPTPPAPASPDYSRLLLENGDRHLTVINEYGRRRAAGAEALAHACAVLCPGAYLMRVHATMGVPPAKLRHVRLGQPHFDLLQRIAKASPYYDTCPWDPKRATTPLRLAYFGSFALNKGLATLRDAVPLLPGDVLSRVHISVHAAVHPWGGDTAFRAAMARHPQVVLRGAYDVWDLPGISGGYDVCIFPNFGLENSPFVVIEALNAGKFVIGSRLGATMDWIHPPRNGILFDHDQPARLAEAISSIVRGDVRIPSPWQIHHASEFRTYPEYVREVDRIYAEFALT